MTKQGRLSDAQFQEKLRQLQRRRERRRGDDIRALMKHDWGRRLVYWLCYELGNLHAPSFTPEIKDGIAAAMHTARNEGMRELAGEFLSLIKELAPQEYLSMMGEEIRSRQEDLALEVDT